MCIRHLGFITGVNLQPLKMQGRFEDGKKKNQTSIFQTCTYFFSLLIKFQLVKPTGVPQPFVRGDWTTHSPSGGEQRVSHSGLSGSRTNQSNIPQQLSALVRKARLTFLWSHSSDWTSQTGCVIAQMYWSCKDFPQESVSNALWMNLAVHVVHYNIFSWESSAFHHENLLPNAESLGG